MTSNIMLTLAFLAGVLAVYYLTPRAGRLWLLLAASLLFYLSADPRMLLLSGGSTLWSYFAGIRTEEAETKKEKKLWLTAAVVPVLLVLFVFKYLNFFTESFAALLSLAGLSAGFPVLSLVLPLGISYYTFKMISYNADIYLGKRKAEKGVPGLCAYLTYILFFPQILSGPIERSEGFLAQLHEGPVYDAGLFAEGIQRIVLGLFKKMVIANRLSAYVDTIFSAPEAYPGLACVMAAVFYSFQIYCDFSGYSDIAIGMGNLLGIRSKKNFDCPYFSRGIKEFWSRWHISLSSWLKDYVYIPLGGNRVSSFRYGVNIMVTFLVSGLWHGASWTFVIWGGIHGVWNLLSGKKKPDCTLPRRIWQTALTFLSVTLGWIFFRAESLGAAFSFLKRIVTGFSLSYLDIQNSILPFTRDNTCAAYFLTACGFLFLLFLYERGRVYGRTREKGETYLSAFWLAVMTMSVVLFGVFGVSGFLYANF
ncbi:MAG TPA: MBOAT family protein [Candidatus Merdisoma merdipullorum]|nr:MBOAT family protein [Candidatus Merdisoma merdipullorum]